MSSALIVLAAVLGLVVGSFLNVVIYRVPRGESLVRPGSRCPACGHPVRARHNVPVIGWLVLRGRCADCGTGISRRYPLVELLTATVFAVMTGRLLAIGLGSAVPAFLYFCAAGIALAAIDLDCRRLPNEIVLPSYPVVAVLLAGSAWFGHDWWALGRAGIGAAVLLCVYAAIGLVQPGGMGMGDIKLSGILGAMLGYLSWTALLVGSFAGFFLGAVAGVILLATGKGNRKSAIPFGPFMIVGAMLGPFIGSLTL